MYPTLAGFDPNAPPLMGFEAGAPQARLEPYSRDLCALIAERTCASQPSCACAGTVSCGLQRCVTNLWLSHGRRNQNVRQPPLRLL